MLDRRKITNLNIDTTSGGRSPHWPSVDTAGAIIACPAVAGALHHTQRTLADRAVALQFVVPLVCGIDHG